MAWCWGHQSLCEPLLSVDPVYWCHDDVIKWKHFPRYWPFVRGIHRSPVNSLQKGQWRRAFMFSLIWTWGNLWVNNSEAGDLRRYRTHYDVIVMFLCYPPYWVKVHNESKWTVTPYTYQTLKCKTILPRHPINRRISKCAVEYNDNAWYM